MSAQSTQTEIIFNSGLAETGCQKWLDQRRASMTRLAAELGLPLDRQVEICLTGDVRLVGILRLAQPPLFIDESRNVPLELRIDHCTFTPRDIQSCVRLD
jgi:hypothetical protein